MNTPVRWIASRPKAQCWRCKKDMPTHLQSAARRIAFRFETVWCAFNHEKAILLVDGRWLPTIEFWLATPGHVIGTRDLQAASVYKWDTEWRHAYADLSLQRAGLLE